MKNIGIFSEMKFKRMVHLNDKYISLFHSLKGRVKSYFFQSLHSQNLDGIYKQ